MVTVREGLALDTATYSANVSSLGEEDPMGSVLDLAVASPLLPSVSIPLSTEVVDAAAQTDICMFNVINKDTQYPECKSPPANPKRSICSLVNVPLKSPPAHLRLNLQEKQTASLGLRQRFDQYA